MLKLWIIFFVVTLVFALESKCQKRSEAPFTTPNTTLNPNPDPKTDKPKEKKLQYIIKKDTKKFLPGNKCFEDVTKDMGFMYMAVPKGQSYYTSEFDRNMHNLGVKLIILFKNGPFWKLKVNKMYKKCKYEYGDFIG